jgi:hypothetical protein
LRKDRPIGQRDLQRERSTEHSAQEREQHQIFPSRFAYGARRTGAQRPSLENRKTDGEER